MSRTSETVSRLIESQLSGAVQTLISAFFNDPLVEYLFPEHGKRREQLVIFFTANLQYTLAAGEIYTSNSLDGIAAWLFRGHKAQSGLTGAGDPRSKLGEQLDIATFARLTEFTRWLISLHGNLIHERHNYLLFLGVEAKKQGKGIGSALIKHGLKTADLDKLPCLLDTMNERDLAFYRKHDFEIMCEEKISGSGPCTWTLLRHPRII